MDLKSTPYKRDASSSLASSTKMRYTNEQIIENAKNVKSMAGLLRSLGLKPVGGNFNTMRKKVAILNIDCSHWTRQDWNKGESLKEWSEYKRNSSIKKQLLKIRGRSCEDCGLSVWKNNSIPIELHHIDGNVTNNVESNLQLLCPNCHSFTPNFRRSKVEKEDKKLKVKNKPYSICQKCSQKCAYRATKCMECYNLERGKDIPSKEQLEQDLIEFKNNMCAIGRKYGVSDNAVRKWIKKLK